MLTRCAVLAQEMLKNAVVAEYEQRAGRLGTLEGALQGGKGELPIEVEAR